MMVTNEEVLMNLVSRYSISEALGAIIDTILDSNCEILLMN